MPLASLPCRRILVLNTKGGCGKSTIATNLAACYASRDFGTAILDYDPQGSSSQWLSLRPETDRRIHGIAAWQQSNGRVTRAWQMRAPSDTRRLILDAPAGVQGHKLQELVAGVNVIVLPVLPSPIDIHATARFIQELLLVAKVRARGVRIGVVANRVRPGSEVYHSLERFLNSLDIPFVARLTESESYLHAAAAGRGVCEQPDPAQQCDLAAWDALVDWVEDALGSGTRY